MELGFAEKLDFVGEIAAECACQDCESSGMTKGKLSFRNVDQGHFRLTVYPGASVAISIAPSQLLHAGFFPVSRPQ